MEVTFKETEKGEGFYIHKYQVRGKTFKYFHVPTTEKEPPDIEKIRRMLEEE